MQEDQTKYWIWLSRIKGVGSHKLKLLLKYFKEPNKIWQADEEELLKIKGIGKESAEQILKEEYKQNLEKYQYYMEQNNIQIITIRDNLYPHALKQIYDFPIILFVKGNTEILNENSIAIVGCRECSNYGKKVAIDFAEKLAQKNIVVVSGLAKGIDTYAHIGCLNKKGKTIAVVGSGLDIVYPSINKKLQEEIIKHGGCIVSEYIVGTKPLKINFPARNRIISGISNGVIVVEAKKKSGTLITVDFALEQGKEIYVVPGNITSYNSEGTNELIKQGARLITNIEDITN